MDERLQKLTNITDSLYIDLQEQRHESCAQLLHEREEILQDILVDYEPNSGQEMPDDLRTVLNHIRHLDAEMETILKQQMSETGKEIARACDIKKRKKTPATSCCLNRQV